MFGGDALTREECQACPAQSLSAATHRCRDHAHRTRATQATRNPPKLPPPAAAHCRHPRPRTSGTYGWKLVPATVASCPSVASTLRITPASDASRSFAPPPPPPPTPPTPTARAPPPPASEPSDDTRCSPAAPGAEPAAAWPSSPPPAPSDAESPSAPAPPPAPAPPALMAARPPPLSLATSAF